MWWMWSVTVQTDGWSMLDMPCVCYQGVCLVLQFTDLLTSESKRKTRHQKTWIDLINARLCWKKLDPAPAGTHYVDQKTVFLAKHCNFIAMSGYCHNMSSVVCLQPECIMTKRLKIGLCSLHYNVAQFLNALPAKFDDKIRRGPLDMGVQSTVGYYSTSLRYISEIVRDRA